MPVSNARIILHFDIHEPIELMELTLSFGSLAKQYRGFLMDRAKDAGKKVHDADVKLFITKIENNCILAELAGATDILGSLFTILDYTNTFIDFTKNINSSIQFFKGLTKKKEVTASEIPFSKRQCEDFSNFLGVVAKNRGGKLGIAVAEYNAEKEDTKHHVKFTFTSDEAYEAQKGAILAQSILDQKGEADHKNVLMYFHQTNIEDSKVDGRTGEKAIIKAIYPKELPVYIISDLDRDKIRSYKDDPYLNPFKASYRVDVNVETDRNDIPRFYRVLSVHEIIPGDDNDIDNTPAKRSKGKKGK